MRLLVSLSPRITRIALVLGIWAFIATWPLERRHIVYTVHSFSTGAFTDAATLSLYASDVTFVILAILWYLWVSSKKEVPKGTLKKIFKQNFMAFGLLLLFWACIRSLTLEVLAWYGVARIIQGLILSILVSTMWTFRDLRRTIIISLAVAGLFQSVVSVIQVKIWSSIGLKFLGEQKIDIMAPGVAKVDMGVPLGTDNFKEIPEEILNGKRKILRGYGTFPHPNVLSGFLLVSLVSAVFLPFRMRKVQYEVTSPEGEIRHSTLQFLWELTVLCVCATIIVGLLSSFSRSGVISLLSLSLLVSTLPREIIPRRRILTLACSVLLGFTLFLAQDSWREALRSRIIPPAFDSFLRERSLAFLDLLSISRRSWLIGSGPSHGILEILTVPTGISQSDMRRPSWSYQYPHSLPLVILLELGIVGLSICTLMLFTITTPLLRWLKAYSSTEVNRSNLLSFRTLTLIMLSIGTLTPSITDHYLWTIQQGRILLWGILGVLLAYSLDPIKKPARECEDTPGGNQKLLDPYPVS